MSFQGRDSQAQAGGVSASNRNTERDVLPVTILFISNRMMYSCYGNRQRERTKKTTCWGQLYMKKNQNNKQIIYEIIIILMPFLFIVLFSKSSNAEMWATTNAPWSSDYHTSDSLLEFNGRLFAGVSANAKAAQLWSYDGSEWRNTNAPWSSNYDLITHMAVYRAKLYVGVYDYHIYCSGMVI